MKNIQYLRVQDLINNPTPRIPVCLCLDASASMQGARITELNAGVKQFYSAILEDETARYSAEICIVTFGPDGVKCHTQFSSMDMQPDPPVLEADGWTPMGEALNMGLDMLEERKREYQVRGVDYYQPWLVLMTDGVANGSESELSRAIQRANSMEQNRKLTIFPIGIGEDADMKTLAQVSTKRTPLKLKGLKFAEFFAWLSQSVARTSQSVPGESVPLDMNGIRGWAEI